MSLADQVATRTRWLRRRPPGHEATAFDDPAGLPVREETVHAASPADPEPPASPATARGSAEAPEPPVRRRTTRPRTSRPRASVPAETPAETPDEAPDEGSPLGPPPTMATTQDVRILLVEDVPQVADRVRELLRSQDTLRLVAIVSDGRKVDDAIGEHRPDVVLVDLLLQGRVKGPAVIERLRRTRNPLPCVAITVPDRPLPAEVERSVDAVLTLPFGTFDLVRGIRGAVTAGAARNPTLASRIVAVFSAKGGVGKTTIALNLAVAMQEMGLRTALVDGSLQFADVRRMLGAPSGVPSIIDLPTDAVRSSDLAELMMRGPAGIDVLLAPPRLEQAELVTTRDLDKILDILRRSYHAIVIDTPSSLGEMTLAMLDAADVVLQVVTPETAALDITRLASEAFAGIGYPQAKLQLLLNRADAQGPVGGGQVHQAFGRDPDHAVASDWALVARSNARGIPFVTADPDAAVSRDMRAVAERVAAVVGALPSDPVVTRRRRGRA